VSTSAGSSPKSPGAKREEEEPFSPGTEPPSPGVDSIDSDEMDNRALNAHRAWKMEQKWTRPRYALVLASDGIWEQIPPAEVGAKVAQHAQSGATSDAFCKALVHDARARWLTRRGVADDITVLLTWLA
jgi:hypothetical protein